MNSNITYELLRTQAAKFRAAGIELTPALAGAIVAYSQLLLRWNRKINLTTITDPQEILRRNFVESFYGARWLADPSGTLCDVGSGAGFPGLALKLVRPGWSVRLFEPNLKKAAFLAEVARQLHLADVEVLRQRWQESEIALHSIDTVTVRAVGGYEAIANRAQNVLKPTGRLLLWLGAVEAEIVSRGSAWKWQTESLPDSRERVLLVGMPTSGR